MSDGPGGGLYWPFRWYTSGPFTYAPTSVGEVVVRAAEKMEQPAIGALHDAPPDIRVLLNTSTQVLNLAKREADIAIRTGLGPVHANE